MVSLVPRMTFTAGVSVSQWPDTTRMALGGCGPARPVGTHDLRKWRAGSESSMESVGEPWEM